jgi:hypothetical protein
MAAAIRAHPTIASIGVTLVAIGLFAMLTPRITFNDGLGNDGAAYASLTEALRGKPAEPQWAGFVYRLLPSALVAATPFDVVTGFLIINVLSLVGSAILLLRLLGRYGVSPALRILALLWWISLPMAARWAIYYPVLGDALGFFVLLALIICALERRLVQFAIGLLAGVLIRENLVMMIPFLWRAHLPRGAWRWTLVVAAITIPAVATAILIRAFPPVAPTAESNALSQTAIVALQLVWIVQNRAGEAWRVLLAAPLSLGLLVVIPVFRSRESWRFISREKHWLYFLLLAVILGVVGGRDTDRYLYVLAPLLLVLTFAVHHDLWRSWPRTAALFGLQLVALRVGWPIGTSESAYLQYTTGFMELDRLAAFAGLVALASAAAGLVVRSASPSGDSRETILVVAVK